MTVRSTHTSAKLQKLSAAKVSYVLRWGMREFILVHISDLHLKSAKEPDTSVLESAIGSLVNGAKACGTKILLVTGDLVDAPTDAALAGAKQFVSRLGALFDHQITIPGNHDAKRFLGNVGYSLNAYNETFGPPKDLLLRDIGVHLIGIDSTPAEFARGAVTGEEYDNFVKYAYKAEGTQDDETRGLIRIVAVHHHPLPLAIGEEEKFAGVVAEDYMYLRAPAKFLEACISCNVRLILHGHRHVPGVARYSIPSNQGENIYDESCWRGLYVLSCPSSTGKGSDAGFNVVRGGGTYLDVTRYERSRNAGRFDARDKNFPNDTIRLQLGSQVERDIGIDIEAKLRELPSQPLESVLLPLATKLFKRRAFFLAREREWRYLYYATVLTRMVWEQQVDERLQGHRKKAGEAVRSALNRLESFTEQEVLHLGGADADFIKSSYMRNKGLFVEAIRDPMLSHHDDRTTELEKRRAQILDELREGLRGCGIDIPSLGAQEPGDYCDIRTGALGPGNYSWDTTIYSGGLE